MVVSGGGCSLAQQARELVECRDFHRAGPGKLFLHAAEGGLGQETAHGTDDFFSIGLRRFDRIDIQRIEALAIGDRRRCASEFYREEFVQIRGWIGAH